MREEQLKKLLDISREKGRRTKKAYCDPLTIRRITSKQLRKLKVF